MNDLMDIKLFEHLNVLFNHDLNVDQILKNVSDLNSIKTLLQYAVYNEIQTNLDVDDILRRLQPDNCTKICDILKLHLKIQQDVKETQNTIINSIKMSDGLVRMTLLDVLLSSQCEELTPTIAELLDTILSEINGSKEQEKYFLYNLSSNLFKVLDPEAVIGKIFTYCSKNDSLSLLCGLPSVNLPYLAQIFSKQDFWQLIQNNLSSDNIGRHKQAIYLLKVALDLLKTQNRFIGNGYVEFTINNKAQIFDEFNQFMILFDISNEKQLHLIEPYLNKLANLRNLHDSWMKILYVKFFTHPQIGVNQQTIKIYLKSRNVNLRNIQLDLLNAANRVGELNKSTLRVLDDFLNEVDQYDFDIFLQQSLNISWTPNVFYQFYKVILNSDRSIDTGFLLEVTRKAFKLPHKYIRLGLLQQIYLRCIHGLDVSEDLLNITYQFYANEETKHVGMELMSCYNFYTHLYGVFLGYLSESNVDLMAFLIDCANVCPDRDLVEELRDDFINRKYSYAMLDHFTNLYLVDVPSLLNYLAERLDCNERAVDICHFDKPSSNLLKRAENVLISGVESENQTLAFEILYYANANKFLTVYQRCIKGVYAMQQKHIVIQPDLAESFALFLLKLPTEYLTNGWIKVAMLVEVYQEFLFTQPNTVIMRIYQNLNLLFEHLSDDHEEFIDLCIKQLLEMKGCDCFESATRVFIRNLALNYQPTNLRSFTVRKLFELSLENDLFVYYLMMYFKYVDIGFDVFPCYEYLTYGDVLLKTERIEYDVCMDVYRAVHKSNPHFRTPEIHKWALESILSKRKLLNIELVVEKLIEMYMTTYEKRYFANSKIHLDKFRIYQTFAFLVPHLSPISLQQLFELIIKSLTNENHQTSVRLVMQYILIEILYKNPEKLNQIWDLLQLNNIKLSSIIITVLFGIEQRKNDAEFTCKLLDKLLEFSMGANFKLRLYSQTFITKIIDRNTNNRKIKSKYTHLQVIVNNVLNATQSPDNESLTLDIEMMQCIINVNASQKQLVYLLCVLIPEKTSMCKYEWEYFKIKNAWRVYVKENLNATTEEPEEVVEDTVGTDNVQKKIVPLNGPHENTPPENKFVLVASLIDSYANLGGLSRTCEIFNIGQMAVSKGNVINEKEFQSLSMSSERWIDLKEVKVDNLGEYLRVMKEQNYTIVGAEQTIDSVQLNGYKFNEKTVLVLGNERSGIPANLLPYLDVCIEIPQFGVVRSLNVHVAGAMFIWEYVKQHRLVN